jgi:hypothetical protein
LDRSFQLKQFLLTGTGRSFLKEDPVILTGLLGLENNLAVVGDLRQGTSANLLLILGFLLVEIGSGVLFENISRLPLQIPACFLPLGLALLVAPA